MVAMILSHINLPDAEFLLIAGRAVFLIFSFLLAAVTFSAWRRAAGRQTEQLLSRTEGLLEQLAEMKSTLASTADCVKQLTERFDRQASRAAVTHGTAPGYQVAIRLARAGASAEELMSGCGLTAAEAELARRLHGPPRPELRQAS